jgi:hypothetical protein
MQTKYVKAAISAIWISTTIAVGIALPVVSLPGWAALAACAVLPLLGLDRMYREPAPTMSESIQKALR